MRVMANTAPQSPVTIARTYSGQSLDVADHPEFCFGARRHDRGKRCTYFPAGFSQIILALLTRVQNLGDSQQVALLAYAIPRSALQASATSRSGCLSRMCQVRLGIPRPRTQSYCKARKRRRFTCFLFPPLGPRLPVTKKAARGYRSREVRVGQRSELSATL